MRDFFTFAIGLTVIIIFSAWVVIAFAGKHWEVTIEHYNDGIVCYVYGGQPVNCLQEESLP